MAIKINGVTVIADTQAITTTSTISAAGNVTAGNVSVVGTITAAGINTGSSPISTSGNIIGGNILTGGVVSATGDVTGGNIITAGTISAIGNIRSASVYVAGEVSATANVTGQFISSAGGNIGVPDGVTTMRLGHETPTTIIIGTNASSINMGNTNSTTAVAGNLTVGANISATGNITGSFILGNGRPLTGQGMSYRITAANSLSYLVNGTGANATIGLTRGQTYYFDVSAPSHPFWIKTDPVIGTGNAYSSGVVNNGAGNGQVTFQVPFDSPGTLYYQCQYHTGMYGVLNINDGTGIQSGNSNVQVYGNGNVATSAAGSSNVTVVTSTGLLINGTASATSTITGGNLATGGTVSATGNITGANLVVSTNIYDASTMTLVTGAGDIQLQPAANVNVNNKNINNLAQPTQDQDAATKIYVDNAVSTQLTYHQAVTAATNTTLATATGGTITYNQPNGAGNGLGATLTTTGSFNLIDTANVQTVGTRILVKDEGNAVFNGVYVWSNATVITRSTDADSYGANSITDLSLNDYFFVNGGNVNKGSAWICDGPSGIITFGTSNISFAQFSSSQVYTANTSAGVSLTGTVISAKVDGTTTAFDGGGNISVKASATLTTPNIGAATGTSLSVTGAVTAASTVGGVITGSSASVTGNVTGGNLVTGGNVTTTGSVNAQGTVSATGNIVTAGTFVGNFQGNITGNLTVTGSNTQVLFNTNGVADAVGGMTYNKGSNTFTILGVVSSQGNIIAGNVTTAGLITATGNITGGNLSVGTGTITGGNIVNGNGNGIGNIGSSTTYFNTVFAKATSAQYADLAEKYTADAEYAPGTVLVFGGTAEVTVNAVDGDTRVAGVVSTNPSYIMNSGLDSEHVATVALTGRVPTMVVGTIKKGDLMVAAGLGRARAEADPKVGTVIGKALEDFDGAEGTIEVVVGRF